MDSNRETLDAVLERVKGDAAMIETLRARVQAEVEKTLKQKGQPFYLADVVAAEVAPAVERIMRTIVVAETIGYPPRHLLVDVLQIVTVAALRVATRSRVPISGR